MAPRLLDNEPHPGIAHVLVTYLIFDEARWFLLLPATYSVLSSGWRNH